MKKKILCAKHYVSNNYSDILILIMVGSSNLELFAFVKIFAKTYNF